MIFNNKDVDNKKQNDEKKTKALEIKKKMINDFARSFDELVLNEQEKATLEQFNNGIIELNQQYARILIDIISKLQKSFTKIEIGHDVMMKIFSRPMTKQQALDALASYIDNKSRGHKPEDVRIIIK